MQIRHVCRMAYGESLPADARVDGEVPVYGSNGCVGWHTVANTVGSTIIIGRKGSHGKLQFSIVPVFAIDTTYFVDSRSTDQHLKWVYYALLAAQLNELGHDVGVPGLSREDAYAERVPSPPQRAQRAIADFLDIETARIDAVIAKKRRLVDILNERRVRITWSACSGLLTPAGARVAGTLAWMGSRPAHWDEVLLRLVARLGSGHTPSRDHPEWWEDCAIPWITTGEVAQMRSDRVEYISRTRESISQLGLENSAAELHPSGTVVLCRTASAGYSAIMGRDMATSQDFATWTCGPLLRPRFLLLCLRAMRSDLLGRLAMGSTHKTIYMPDIQAIRIPLPPVEEQDDIVIAAWARLHRCEAATDKLTRQIELLLEHRQALITAAVTGEMEVPGVAA